MGEYQAIIIQVKATVMDYLITLRHSSKIEYSMSHKNSQGRSSTLLPAEIASRILDLEMDYEKRTICREGISELMGLYSQAVEFYEEHHDQKFIVFQNRLTNVLKNPYVVSILEGQSANKIKCKQIQEIKKAAETSAAFDASSLLKTFSDQKSKVEMRVDKQVSIQKSKILQRVMNRSFNKSFTGSQSKIEDPKKGYDSFIVDKNKEKPKKDVKKGSILDVFSKLEVFELPQRRKNIRAPLF